MTDDSDDLDGPILDPADDAAITALLADLPELDMPDDVAAARRHGPGRRGAACPVRPPRGPSAAPPTSACCPPSASATSARPPGGAGSSPAPRRSCSCSAPWPSARSSSRATTRHRDRGRGGTDLCGTTGASPVEATLLSSSGAAYTQADLAPKVSGLVARQAPRTRPSPSGPPEAPPRRPRSRAPTGSPADLRALVSSPSTSSRSA